MDTLLARLHKLVQDDCHGGAKVIHYKASRIGKKQRLARRT